MEAIQQIIEECAPSIPQALMKSLVARESNFKQFAIGMDAKQGYVKQPETLEDAVKTIGELKKAGRSFSVGLGQIHISNIEKYNLSWEQAFDPCVNLHTSELILWQFYNQAVSKGYSGASALFAMLRGYNSGNIEWSVSNGYASAILKNANVSNYAVLNEGYANTKVKVSLNALKPNDAVTEEGNKNNEQQDFFSNNSNTSDDFFQRNKLNEGVENEFK